MKYKKYLEYKDSGIEWFNEIPQKWELKRLKYSTKGCLNGAWGDEPQENSNDIICVRVADFNRDKLIIKDNNFTFRNLPKEKRVKLMLSKGDLIIEKSGGGDNQPVGFVVQYNHDYPAITSNFVAKIPPNNVNSNYFKYFHSYLYSIRLNIRSIKQTTGIQNLDAESYFNEKAIYPPIKEQELIANFLDKETSRLDGLIYKNKRLIELLKEKRQGLINRALTKGIDKSAKLKSSGIDWIDDVPQHWELKKLKYEFKIKKDIAGTEGYNILAVTQSGIKIKDISSNEGQLSMDYSKYQLVNVDDYVMNHMDLLTGYVDCSQYVGVTSPDYRVFYLINKNNNKSYFKNMFQICYKNKIFYGLGQGVSNFGRWRLQSDKFLNFVIPIPPTKEQEQIACYIDKKSKDIDTLLSKVEQQIEKLKEYKQTLISNAVTGKIDVRDCA